MTPKFETAARAIVERLSDRAVWVLAEMLLGREPPALTVIEGGRK